MVSAGERKGFNDPRAKVLLKVIEILNFHKPECIVFENVKNLLSHDKGKSFQRIRDKIEKAGYSITYKVLNTSEITGIPQHRERVYLVGVRNEDILDEFNLYFPTVEKLDMHRFFEHDVERKYCLTKVPKFIGRLEKRL